MSGYDYAEFLIAVARQRTRPTGCFVCDVLEREHPRTVSRCARISGARPPDAHHLIPKRVLHDELAAGLVSDDGVTWRRVEPRVLRYDPDVVDGFEHRLTLDDLKMDVRNGVLLSRYHHDLVESHGVVIPLAKMPRAAMDFAREIGLEWWHINNESRRS